MDDSYGTRTYTFKSNGTGMVNEVYWGSGYSEDSWTFQWMYNEDTGYLNIIEEYEDGIDAYRCRISYIDKDKLVLIEEDGAIRTLTRKGSNNSQSGNASSKSIVGSWKHIFSTGYVVITFNKDGSGNIREVDYEDGNYSSNFIYTYNEKTGAIKVKEDGETYYYTVISVNSKELVLKDPDGYTDTYYKY